ncbi:hypothetical protein L211DRAFT_334605 [Terfezia boudieri ATCC MYA-4762]|uniref:Uncharacterized protein n=1 Tax=Terfezia boudieri ATCC MYA-4762 TaxID=1051890 RepID=A0A3N4LWE5_9PEZI|nr:hypothetical protein L211DRAFT_334605 [Terfezia boudieri ATCC MYA-4762]
MLILGMLVICSRDTRNRGPGKPQSLTHSSWWIRMTTSSIHLQVLSSVPPPNCSLWKVRTPHPTARSRQFANRCHINVTTLVRFSVVDKLLR